MSRLVVAALLRNEASRFLASALAAWGDFADEMVVLDDNSDDGRTVALCHAAGAHVYSRVGTTAWGTEAPARAELWQHALEHAEPGDFIFVLDGDMVPAHNPRPLFERINADGVCFPLFDIWQDDGERLWYRTDGAWSLGPIQPRIWAVRVPPRPPADGWQWHMRGVHCGHIPANFYANVLGFAPHDFGLLHFAYSTPELRREKAAQYALVFPQLTEFERKHADSILDPAQLAPIRFNVDYKLELAE